MEERIIPITDVLTNVRGANLNHLNRLLNFLRAQKTADITAGRTVRSWALGDIAEINIKGRGNFKFRPVAYLDDTDDSILGLHGQDFTHFFRLASAAENIPPYDVPCWGFCDAGQEVPPERGLVGLSDRDCHFVPFGIDNANTSEWNFQKGEHRWGYQVNGRPYTVTRVDDTTGFFIQRSADGQQVRQVLRIPNNEAKRMVIQRGILASIPANTQSLVAPLFQPENFVQYMGDCSLVFPVALYEKMGYSPPGYEEVNRQGLGFEHEYGMLTISEALAILDRYSDLSDERRYPFSQGISIKF